MHVMHAVCKPTVGFTRLPIRSEVCEHYTLSLVTIVRGGLRAGDLALPGNKGR